MILSLQGSWGGVGVRNFPPKPQRIQKVAGMDPTTRADLNKKRTTALESSIDALLKPAGSKDEERTGEIIDEDDQDDDDGRAEGVEGTETGLTLKGQRKASCIKSFGQRDLISIAFAGDNVVQVRSFRSSFFTVINNYYYSTQNFEEAKNREIASDAPREVDTTIPGWVKFRKICLLITSV